MNCFLCDQEPDVGTKLRPVELKDVTLNFQEEKNMVPQGCPYKLLRKIAPQYPPLKAQEDEMVHNVSMAINQSCTSFLIFNKTLNCNILPFGLLQAKTTQKDKTRMQEMLLSLTLVNCFCEWRQL